MLFLYRAKGLCAWLGMLSLAASMLVMGVSLVANAAASHGAEIRKTGEEQACVHCHEQEVKGFARSKMAHSMRLPAHEPEGIVLAPQATLRMSSNREATVQTLESHGSIQEYRVSYVIGSGTHASGFIVSLGDHEFQSPVAYYRRKAAYGLAPGYETESDPDFTRPVKPGCLFCHAGSFAPVPGTINQYAAHSSLLEIGCSRCHGQLSAHLARPSPSNIVNPANLDPASRDSVCEQCHLRGGGASSEPRQEVYGLRRRPTARENLHHLSLFNG